MTLIKAYGPFIIANLIFLLLSTSQYSISLLLPLIQKEIVLSSADQQWIINIPLIVTTSCIILLGKLTDIWNRMRLVQLSLLTFLVGNIVSALSTTFLSLFIGRMLQGLGAAVMLPQSYVLAKQGPHPDSLFSYFIGLSTLCLVVGSGLAGIIGELWGWRWVFGISGILNFGVLLTAIYTSQSVSKTDQKIDYLGALLVAIVSVSTICCIINASHICYWLPWGCMASMALLLLKRHLSTHTHPILAITLLKHESLWVYTAVLCAMQITMAAAYTLPLALQHIFQLNAAKGGILLTLTISPSILIAFFSSYMQKLPTRIIQIALTVLCLGNLLMGCAGYYHSIYGLLVSRFIMSFFVSILFTISMKTILNTVPIALQGTATALVSQFREYSNTCCIAAMHTLSFSTQQTGHIMTGISFAHAMLIPTVSALAALLFFYKKTKTRQ